MLAIIKTILKWMMREARCDICQSQTATHCEPMTEAGILYCEDCADRWRKIDTWEKAKNQAMARRKSKKGRSE